MVRLEKADSNNIWEILKLEVNEEQKDFVATNAESIVEAYLCLANGGQAMPFGVYDDETLVGFVMISYGTDDAWDNAPEIAEGNYGIWRLMIDRRYQGRGYGRKAAELAIEYVKTKPCGEAQFCYLSYEPENEVAKRLYSSLGFVETGEFDEGEAIAAMRI